MLRKIVFEDAEYEYDPKEVKSYRNIKRLARAQKDPSAFFDVAEAIFAGKDEEYAEQLGNDMDKLGSLVAAIIDQEGEPVKN